MAPASNDPVLSWASIAADAERATGVPASVLLGLIRVESGGREGLTSSAGAGGLTQFMPATARSYDVDVRPGHARSQIMGAARYLRDLGYADDPERALASYNGGPGNADIPVTRAYARRVLEFAKSTYKGFDGGHNPITQPTRPTSTTSSPGRLVDREQHSTLVRFGVQAALVLTATIAVAVGVARLAGVRNPLAAAGAKA